MLALRQTSIFCFDMPLSFGHIKLRANNDRLERAVLLDIQDFVNMIKVSSQLFVIGIIGRPCPVLVDLWPGKLILRHLRINTCSWISVPSPRPTKARASLIYHGSESMLAEGFETKDAT
jgi:hypothetical protein